MAVLQLKKWGWSIGDNQPLACIAGLNVLEDLDLTLHVARHLKAVTAALGLPFVFKASFDKANRSSLRSSRPNWSPRWPISCRFRPSSAGKPIW